MKKPNKTNPYFYSIQPFWDSPDNGMNEQILSSDFSVSWFCHTGDALTCVPGNGQITFRLSDTESFRGICFGVMDDPDSIPLHGLSNGILLRFAPGVFSKIFQIPSTEICAYGIPVEEILSADRLSKLKEASLGTDKLESIYRLIGRWSEESNNDSRYWDNCLIDGITQMVWNSSGTVRIQELSAETGYSSRYLQEILNRQVGLAPKKFCKHVRFQKALKMLEMPGISTSTIAYALGYSDQAHFCREFKDYCGITPKESRLIIPQEPG